VSSSDFLHETSLMEKVNLEKLLLCDLKEQVAGTCGYASHKGILHALLAIENLKKADVKEPWLSTYQWSNAFKRVRPIYRSFTLYDRENVLESFGEDLQEKRIQIEDVEKETLQSKILGKRTVRENERLAHLTKKIFDAPHNVQAETST
jgi:hypothetical protein